MSRCIRSVCLFLLFLLAPACREEEREAPSRLEWRYDASFAERVDEVQRDAAGNIWVARSRLRAPDAKTEAFLETRSPEGSLLAEPIALGEALVAGFTVLDDGTAAVALYLPDDGFPGLHALKLLAVEGGKVVREKAFTDFSFEVPTGYACDFEMTRTGFMGTGGVRVSQVAGGIALLTYNCAYSRLSLLERDFTVRWSTEISTPRTDLESAYGNVQLVVGKGETLFTTAQITGTETDTFNAHFDERLTPLGEADILLSAHDTHGARLFSAVTGSDKKDRCVALASTGDTIFLAGAVQVDRPTSVRSLQDDVWLSAFDPQIKKGLWSSTHDVQDEDLVTSLALLGGKYLAVGGTTGRLQVPTMSVVKHGDALVLVTDLEGRVVGKKVFGTSRDDAVQSIVDLGGSKVLVGGSKDGPITHDGDEDKSQLHRYGFVETFATEDLLGQAD